MTATMPRRGALATRWSNIRTPDWQVPVTLFHGNGLSTVLDMRAWDGALTMAHWAGWKPKGTTLVEAPSRYRYGYQLRVSGRSYLAEAGDVKALAAALRKALAKGATMSHAERQAAVVTLEVLRDQPTRHPGFVARWLGDGAGHEEVIQEAETWPWLAPALTSNVPAGERIVAFPHALRGMAWSEEVADEYRRLADRLASGGTVHVTAIPPQGWVHPATPTKRVEVVTDRPVALAGGMAAVRGEVHEVAASEVRGMVASGIVREVDEAGQPVEPACCPTCGHCVETALPRWLP